MTEKGFDSFTSIPAVKAAFSAAGSYWFTPGAMKFFNTKIESSLIGGRYFITSERYESGEPKLSNIRKIIRDMENTPSLDIETVGEHMTYKTKQEAMNALEEYRKANTD
jgi:hypothetical protein